MSIANLSLSELHESAARVAAEIEAFTGRYSAQSIRVLDDKLLGIEQEIARRERAENGYCEHGVYVGGCGVDWMCGWCESGSSWAEYVAYCNSRIRVRTHQNMVAAFFSAIPNGAVSSHPYVLSIALGILNGPNPRQAKRAMENRDANARTAKVLELS